MNLIIGMPVIAVIGCVAFSALVNATMMSVVESVKSDVRETSLNVAVELVKDPTAEIVGTSSDKVIEGPVFDHRDALLSAENVFRKIYGDASVKSTVKVGDSKGAHAVLSDDSSYITVNGTWEGYTVIGQNLKLQGQYMFDSVSGKHTGTGDYSGD